MGSSFDYTDTNTPDDVIRRVAAEMGDAPLKPLSDDERLERQIWREQQAFLAETRDAQYRQYQHEQAAEAEAIARHERALEQAELNRKARLERQAQIERQVRDREIADLHLQSTRQQNWQKNVQAAARNTIAYQQRQTLMNELEAAINPPAPPPENPTEIVYVEAAEGSDQLGTSDFNPKLWMQKPRSWW